MTDTDQLSQVARERADKRIDQAIGELHAAASEIGRRHAIPEGIAGHSVDELLGRMAYIPSMARDLRRMAAQELAKLELARAFDQPAPPPQAAPQKPQEPSTLPGSVPVSMDVGDLDGVTVQAVRALRGAGLTTVGDIARVPDEHLLKISGLAERSVQQIRAAIAKASAPAPPPVA